MGFMKQKSLQESKYKMTERQIFEKFDNLSEDKLIEKSSKNVYIRNDVMTIVINPLIVNPTKW